MAGSRTLKQWHQVTGPYGRFQNPEAVPKGTVPIRLAEGRQQNSKDLVILGTWFNGGLGGTRLKVGPDDLRHLS